MATTSDFIVRNGLQAYSNAAIGSYATVNSAPTYGMIASGNVGIGTSTVNICNVQVQGEAGGRSYWNDAVLDLVQPTLNLDFLNRPRLDPRVSFIRASNATVVNSVGVLTTVGYNQPRFEYDPTTLAPRGLLMEESRTNYIRNNTMIGAVAGSPGTLPTNWGGGGSLNGITQTIVGTGISNGINYIDINYSGTATAATILLLLLDGITTAPTAAGQTWTESIYLAAVSGSTSGIAGQQFGWYVYDSASTYLGSQQTNTVNMTGTLTRYSSTATIVLPTAAYVRPYFFLYILIDNTVDITIRFGLPQMEQGTFVTSVIPTTGATATRAVDQANVPVGTWYNQQSGTLYVETNQRGGANGAGAYSTSLYKDSSNFIAFQFLTGASGSYGGWATVANASASSSLVPSNVSNVDIGTNMRSAVSFDGISNVMVLTNKGVSTLFGSTFPGVPTTITSLTIGARNIGGDLPMTGNMRKLAYYPARLSNATVQSMTII